MDGLENMFREIFEHTEQVGLKNMAEDIGDRPEE